MCAIWLWQCRGATSHQVPKGINTPGILKIQPDGQIWPVYPHHTASRTTLSPSPCVLDAVPTLASPGHELHIAPTPAGSRPDWPEQALDLAWRERRGMGERGEYSVDFLHAGSGACSAWSGIALHTAGLGSTLHTASTPSSWRGNPAHGASPILVTQPVH